MVVASVAHANAAELELLVNGSFEQLSGETAASWRGESWEGGAEWRLGEDDAHSGERCLGFVSQAPQGTVVASQRAGLVQPGQPLALSGWWRGEELVGAGARVVCRYLDGRGQQIEDAPPLEKAGSFGWERFMAELEPPAAAASVQVFLELFKATGTAWFDDVSLTQDVQPLDYDRLRIGGGAEEGALRVAVIDGRSLGARTYGAQGLYDCLSRAEGIEAELVADCTLFRLSSYDCVVVPEIQTAGSLGAARIADPRWRWMSDWLAALGAYVRGGGGIVLCHDSVGFRFVLEQPLFPGVGRGVERIEQRQVASFTEHAVTQALEPFECAFSDYITLEAGPEGTAVAFDGQQRPLVVVGEAGGGRAALCGLALGIDAQSKEAAPTGPEARLLENAVRWAAQGTREELVLVVAPARVSVREPKQRLSFDLCAFALSDEAVGRQAQLRVSLRSEGKAAEEQDVRVEVTGDAPMPAAVEFDIGALADGLYSVAVSALEAEPEILPAPRVVAMAEISAEFAKWTDSLPKSQFRWRSCNVHGTGGLRTAEEIEQMVQDLREMNFTALLIGGKPPNGRCYWETEVGTPPEGFEGLDHLKVASEACELAGIDCLVQFCTFVEGAASDPSDFIKQHPELAEYHEGQPEELSERGGSAFGCPDQPEVRQYELALIREIVTKYPLVDGISFDYIRYGNDRWCDCEHSKAMQAEFAEKHPELSEREAKARFAEEQIVSFTWEVREVLDEVRPGLILHGYCHPTWANRFPMQYLSFRASAHGEQPGRGGMWPLERVFEAAKNNVELADDHLDYMSAAPMADTAYLAWKKTPERFRRELRLIYEAGARDIMVYPYSTLRGAPELREMLAEEFGD